MRASQVTPTLFDHTNRLSAYIQTELERFETEAVQFPLDSIFFEQMQTFLTAGKLFRGSLFLHSYELLQGAPITDAVLRVAAALEIYCSGLLVHDDIMDEDSLRRGQSTSHTVVKEWATQRQVHTAAHFGESVALCYGDILFFWASMLLTTTNLPKNIIIQLLTVSNTELALLGFAQAEDMRLAAVPITAVSQEEIIAMQYGKTGRYTGRWPLILAAVISQQPSDIRTLLGEIGDELGFLYQLRDDYLGLFGESDSTGKNAITDVQAGKKTLYYWYAIHTLSGQDRATAAAIFGNPNATPAEIELLKKMLTDRGCVEKVAAVSTKHMEYTKQKITDTRVPEQLQTALIRMIELITTRQK